MTDAVWILGIHMTRFGKHPSLDAVDLASKAAIGALRDASVSIRDVGILAVGHVLSGPRAFGQQVQKQIGQTGIPVYNVSNACATGATALRTAIMSIKADECDLGLAVGVEKLAGAGLLAVGNTTDEHLGQPTGRLGAAGRLEGRIGTDSTPGAFAQIGMRYLREHDYEGDPLELFAAISEKNHSHSTLNPLAAYTKAISIEEIMHDAMIAYPLTRPMCSANCDGAAAAVVVSERRLRRLSFEQQTRAVKISASVLTSDPWVPGCQVLPDVNTLTRNAADQAYEQAALGPEDLDLVELHDCFATAELVHYENLGLCAQGDAPALVESRATWRDGRIPVNVSGGLQSKGHPVAATGIANIWEVVQHLREEAGPRQIEGARVGLAHVTGFGSACGVHVLERAAR
jgi:acetyl-CoA acetyltransferase